MPITAIDPKPALIVVDLQKGIVGLPLAHPVTDVLARNAELLAAFRRRGLPVVLVNVAGGPGGRNDLGAGFPAPTPEWTELVPELGSDDNDHLITKHSRSAFTRTGLNEWLRRQGVTQVVVSGIATSSGVESTVRDAHEQNFHVTVPIDGRHRHRRRGTRPHRRQDLPASRRDGHHCTRIGRSRRVALRITHTGIITFSLVNSVRTHRRLGSRHEPTTAGGARRRPAVHARGHRGHPA
jgi:nicotinamidase-related amidase